MNISYSKKEVKNLGNYESVAVEIRIDDSVDFEVETPNECFERLKNFVQSKLLLQFNTKLNVIKPKKEITNSNKKSEENKIDYTVLKDRVMYLMEQDATNKEKIKNFLSKEYNVFRLTDLDKSQIEDCYIKLDDLSN